MSAFKRSPRRLRTMAVTTAVLTGLVVAPLAASPATSAAPAQDEPGLTSTVGKQLLTVRFDEAETVVAPGTAFVVSGSVNQVTQALVGKVGVGVPATFTLELTDAAGTVLGQREITAEDDGTFTTTVPGSATQDLGGDEPVGLAVRAVDASYDGFKAADAGATAVQLKARAKRLRLENSFVSSVGWVKPGEVYPSRVLVTNPTGKRVKGAMVVLKAAEGATFRKASGPGKKQVTPRGIGWRLPALKPGRTATLVVASRAAPLKKLDTVVWRDLSSKASLITKQGKKGKITARSTSHGPKVIPPSAVYDTARYGDRPFPVVPVQYTDRSYQPSHPGAQLATTINSPRLKGSTFNLFQEMSLGQLFPDGTVPSAGIATADFDYGPGFDFQETDPATLNTCTGATFSDSPIPAQGTPLYPERITDGVYNLPGQTQWYGADSNGSALAGAVAGVAALQQIDSGCGPTGKLVSDAVALSDPEIDYSDFDTDKDGLVDFFMVVYAGCGGNGASQLAMCTSAPSDAAPYDNIWPHSSSLEFSMSDPVTGLPGFTTDDQLKDLRGRPLFYTDRTYQTTTTNRTAYKAFVRVGPYNVNPETAIDKASVISHEYGHSLGLPDFYSLGGRETYGDWNLMATDKSQNMDAFSRQEMGWVVPQVLTKGRTTVRRFTDSKQDTGKITWKTPRGKKYTLRHGTRRGKDGSVHNAAMYVAKLPGRQLLDPAKFDTGDKATRSHTWFSGSGNDFGCATDGGGKNLDFLVPGLDRLPAGSTVQLSMKSAFDIEWDYDYGFVLTSRDGKAFASQPSERGVATTTATSNPNQNGCQAAYGNGITGSSASYTDPITVQADRTIGNNPESIFVADTFDISELVGAASPVLRFSYSTDPGLARPGWFIDDLSVVATTPSGRKVLLATDFEGEGGPDDARVFNGGCQGDFAQAECGEGWQYVAAGAEAEFDHAYFLEMRDRSGFDLAGQGQIDRDPIGFQPGLSLIYTDEAHGYGNAGTDDPPAQSPLDATPSPGGTAPNLNDAAFTSAPGRNVFSDSGVGHTDSYNDPGNTTTDPRYADVVNPWRFQYDCLAFRVLEMGGAGLGPARSDGDLRGKVQFDLSGGCGTFNYGYTKPVQVKNTAPVARIAASSVRIPAGGTVRFDASRSTDKETPSKLDYVWSYDNGGAIKDAVGVTATHTFPNPGIFRVRMRATDPQGRFQITAVDITVT
ncbi:MAG: PKD domain-containing protein [Nocardioides sp.]